MAERDEDATPVVAVDEVTAARLDLARATQQAAADRALALAEVAELGREVSHLRDKIARLDRINDDLLAASVERDELRLQVARLSLEVNRLRRLA